ncbi:MAG: hypothetical protein OHK0023_07240 [Anaerolineae bacterium]
MSKNLLTRFFRLAGRDGFHHFIALSFGVMIVYLATLQTFEFALDSRLDSLFLLLMLGTGLCLFGLTHTQTDLTTPLTAPTRLPQFAFKRRWLIAAIAAFVFSLVRNLDNAAFWEQLGTWLFGMYAMVKAFQSQPEADPHHLRRGEWLLLLGLFAVALVVRGVNLGSYPPWMDQDEAIFAFDGGQMWQGGFTESPFRQGFHEHPRLYNSFIALSVSLFGNTLSAARLPSVLLSALTIPGVYLLGRELGRRPLGLIAALFCIGWAFWIHFGRLAMNQPGDPLFTVYAFYYFLRGLRLGRPLDFVLSGLSLGVAQLFYLGGLSAVATLIAFVGWLLIRSPRLLIRQWRNFVLLSACVVLVLLPYYGYLLAKQLPFSTRSEKNILLNGEWQLAVDRGAALNYIRYQMIYSFLGTIWIEDRGGWYGNASSIMGVLGGAPLVLGAALALMLLWRSPKWAFVLGWAITVIVLGSTLSTLPPQYQRYVSAGTPFALLVALAVIFVSERTAQLMGYPHLGKLIGIGLGLLLCVGNLAFYFGDYAVLSHYIAARPDSQNRPNWESNAAGAVMVRLASAHQQVVLVESFPSGVQNTLVVGYYMLGKRYWVYERDNLAYLDMAKPIAFIIPPQRLLSWLPQMFRYAGGNFSSVYLAYDNRLAFFIYERP